MLRHIKKSTVKKRARLFRFTRIPLVFFTILEIAQILDFVLFESFVAMQQIFLTGLVAAVKLDLCSAAKEGRAVA